MVGKLGISSAKEQQPTDVGSRQDGACLKEGPRGLQGDVKQADT